MEYKLAGLEPSRVFYYFEEISRIPRGSGNTKGVSDYCKAQAEGMGLYCRQDEWNNIIIKKPGTPGYEAAPTVMLQGHLDMVAEKVSSSSHDFLKDPLDLFVEDGWIGAKDTTLGGDNGIAIALCLALLEDDTLAHPPLECVFTTEEEVGMDGAKGIDLSDCKSRYLINLDSEEEGYLLSGCAGGMRCDLKLPVRRVQVSSHFYAVKLSGLVGGHSGSDINLERGNANVLLGRFLYFLSKKVPFAIKEMAGGALDNVITRESKAVIALEDASRPAFEQAVQEMRDIWKNEYRSTDPDITLTVTDEGEKTETVVSPVDQEKMLFLLMEAPYGVQHMSMEMEGLVETSLNLGILRLEQEAFHIRYAVRSSVGSRKELIADRLEYLIQFIGGEYVRGADYPEWQYQKESKLRALVCDVYRKVSGNEMVVQAIHAGLECGLLMEKMPGLDAVSMGPDMKDVHTPSERLSIASTARTYAFLKEVLAAVKNGF